MRQSGSEGVRPGGAPPPPRARFSPAARRGRPRRRGGGSRWTGEIVRALLAGATRFSEFTAAIPGLSDRLLSERLKDLEAEAIVIRTVVPAKPVRVEYRLTEKGEALASVVAALSAWADEWIGPGAAGACD